MKTAKHLVIGLVFVVGIPIWLPAAMLWCVAEAVVSIGRQIAGD